MCGLMDPQSPFPSGCQGNLTAIKMKTVSFRQGGNTRRAGETDTVLIQSLLSVRYQYRVSETHAKKL